MVDDGEPLAVGRRDRRAAERRALQEAVVFAVIFGGAVLINTVFGLLLIEIFGTFETTEVGNAIGERHRFGTEMIHP